MTTPVSGSIQPPAKPQVHGNEAHDPDFEQEGVAAGLVETHRTTEVHTQPQPPAAHIHEGTDVEVAELGAAIFDDVQDFINFFGDRTYLTGCEITPTGPADGTVVIAPGAAWCKETDSDTAIGRFFGFAGKTGQALTDLTTNIIYLDYNAGTPQIVVATNPLDHSFKQDHILLGVVFRNGNETHILQADPIGIQGDNRSHMMRVEEGPTRSSGMIILAAGVRNLTITVGVLHLGLNRVTTPARDTTPAGGDNFTYWYYDGSLPDPAWVAVPASTQISRTQWNNVALGLVNFTPNRYGVHWVFMDFDGHLHVVYGQGDYTAAEAEGADVPAPLPNVALMFSVIVAKIICQQGTDVLTITYPWTIPFVSALANNHSLLENLGLDDHPQYIRHALATAVSDFLVASGAGVFIKKTLAEVRTLLNWAADIATHAGLTTGIHGVGASTVDSVASRLIDVGLCDTARIEADAEHAADTSTHGATGAVVGTTNTQTLTNKTLIDTSNVVEEISTVASDSTPNPTGGSLRNFYTITALAANATFAAPSGTPANANKLIIRIKDNGTARTLGWNAIYRAMESALPTTTVISKTMYLGFIYNSADSKWDMVAINQEA